MALVIDLLSWALLLSGGFFVVVGSLGLVRMPGFFTRVHAASITDTLGAGLIIGGLLLQSPHWQGAVKLVLIMVFMVLTGPTATHALAKAALHAGLRPHDSTADADGRVVNNGADDAQREGMSSNS